MNVVELFHGRHFRITTECDINDVVNSIYLHTTYDRGNESIQQISHFIRIDSRRKFYDGVAHALKDFDMNEIINLLCELGEVISTIQRHAPIQLGFHHVVEPKHTIIQYPITFDFYLNYHLFGEIGTTLVTVHRYYEDSIEDIMHAEMVHHMRECRYYYHGAFKNSIVRHYFNERMITEDLIHYIDACTNPSSNMLDDEEMDEISINEISRCHQKYLHNHSTNAVLNEGIVMQFAEWFILMTNDRMRKKERYDDAKIPLSFPTFSRNKEEIRKAFMSFCKDFHLYVEYLASYVPSIFVSKLYNDVSIEKEE
nr:MAG TPA: hypothetical protein [Caudoviricetes sp.]